MSVNTGSNGNHQHDLNMVSKDDGNFSNAGGQHPTGDASKYWGTNHNIQVESAGNHTHSVDIPSTTSSTDGGHNHTITGGGDLETRPINISVMWCLKSKPTNSTGAITINSGIIANLTTTGSNGASTLSGTTLNIPQYASSLIGDIKSGIQTADHNGWVKLDGRLKSSLTATQQSQATAFGIGTNLPDATNSCLSQNGAALGTVIGSNNRTINQNQLPNITLAGTTSTAGNHDHGRGGTGAVTGTNWGLIQRSNGSNTTIANTDTTSSEPNIITTPRELGLATDGNHSHTVTTSSINGNVTQETIDIKPQSLSVNMFIYLGN